MAKVGIVMGSDSDMPVMSKAADILDQLGAQNWGQALMKILVNLFTGIGSRWLGGNSRKY